MDFKSRIKKLYYSISEVSEITDLKQSVIRYWETEFSYLSPSKNSSGNRVYKENDIKLIKLIKHLLYDEKLSTIDTRKIIQKYKDEKTYEKELNKYTITIEKKNDDLQLQFDKSENKPSGKSIDELLKRIQTNLESIIKIIDE